ncbi:hypothetical protein [Herbaspirillum sp. ST 5-3]|uniref:hypothetical protein n=1 Tax=Oxalobacteraceae TaxID=75682 RepID=UPI0010A2FD12|nr:hypothetical protein [Herbaspirillum sp. ST 5-3]
MIVPVLRQVQRCRLRSLNDEARPSQAAPLDQFGHQRHVAHPRSSGRQKRDISAAAGISHNSDIALATFACQHVSLPRAVRNNIHNIH